MRGCVGVRAAACTMRQATAQLLLFCWHSPRHSLRMEASVVAVGHSFSTQALASPAIMIASDICEMQRLF